MTHPRIRQFWCAGVLAAVSLAVLALAPVAAEEIGRDEPELTKHARRIDSAGDKTDGTRVSRRIAERFSTTDATTSASEPARSVTAADVQALRNKGFGYGEITIALSLYTHQSGTTGKSLEQIVAMRESGQGWGEIAKSLGYRNLGQAKHDVQRTDRALKTVARPANPEEQKQAERLDQEAKTLDAQTTATDPTAAKERRAVRTIAKELKVEESKVTDLRTKNLGVGEATIALALSKEIARGDNGVTQEQALAIVLERRNAGQGWGVIAHDFDLKLGRVVSEVKHANNEVARIERRAEKAEKPEKETAEKAEKTDKVDKVEKLDKAQKLERLEKPEKVEKFEKIEKVERSEKPERIEKGQRAERVERPERAGRH